MSVLPSLRELKIGLRNRMIKENIIYKIVIDVLDHHFQSFDNIDFKVRYINYKSNRSTKSSYL